MNAIYLRVSSVRDGVSRAIGSLDNRPSVKDHRARCVHYSRWVRSGTHPPPCRSASRTSTRSGPSRLMSATLFRKSTKSVALSRASRKVVGVSFGETLDSDITDSIAAASDIATILFYFSKYPFTRARKQSIRFQKSASSSSGKKYDDPSSRNTRILMIPARPRSTSVLGYISLRASRSSRYASMMSSPEPIFSSQNFRNSAIAASFSSRGQRWNGTGSSPDAVSFSTFAAFISFIRLTLHNFHAIATSFSAKFGRRPA